MEMESSMRLSITEHHALLVRYLMVFLIGYVLLTVHAGADIRKKTDAADPVPRIEPGKAKLVDLASLPPQLRRTVDDEIKRLRAGDGVLYGDMTSEEAHELESTDGRALPLEGALDRFIAHAKVPPADVSASDLAGYTLARVVPEGPGQDGPWTGVRRVYRRPDGVLVMLHEWAYAAEGGGRPAQAAPVREPTRSSSIRSKAAHAPAHASAISAGERTPARSACMKPRQRGPGPASSPCR